MGKYLPSKTSTSTAGPASPVIHSPAPQTFHPPPGQQQYPSGPPQQLSPYQQAQVAYNQNAHGPPLSTGMAASVPPSNQSLPSATSSPPQGLKYQPRISKWSQKVAAQQSHFHGQPASPIVSIPPPIPGRPAAQAPQGYTAPHGATSPPPPPPQHPARPNPSPSPGPTGGPVHVIHAPVPTQDNLTGQMQQLSVSGRPTGGLTPPPPLPNRPASPSATPQSQASSSVTAHSASYPSEPLGESAETIPDTAPPPYQEVPEPGSTAPVQAPSTFYHQSQPQPQSPQPTQPQQWPNEKASYRHPSSGTTQGGSSATGTGHGAGASGSSSAGYNQATAHSSATQAQHVTQPTHDDEYEAHLARIYEYEAAQAAENARRNGS